MTVKLTSDRSNFKSQVGNSGKEKHPKTKALLGLGLLSVNPTFIFSNYFSKSPHYKML